MRSIVPALLSLLQVLLLCPVGTTQAPPTDQGTGRVTLETDIDRAIATALARRAVLIVKCEATPAGLKSCLDRESVLDELCRGSAKALEQLGQIGAIGSCLNLTGEKVTAYSLGRRNGKTITTTSKKGRISSWFRVSERSSPHIVLAIPALGKVVARLNDHAGPDKVLAAVIKARRLWERELSQLPKPVPARLTAKDLEKTHIYADCKVRFYTPPGYDRSRRYPGVMSCMGLGMKHVDDRLWPALAAKGYLVIVARPAAATGRPAKGFKHLLGLMARDVAIDLERMFAIGFSRWGARIMGQLLGDPEAWRGVIAVCHCHIESGGQPVPTMTLANQDLRILVIAGEQDPNTRAIQPAVAAYTNRKFLITLKVVPGLGHLLRREEAPLIHSWLQTQLDPATNKRLARKRRALRAALKRHRGR